MKSDEILFLRRTLISIKNLFPKILLYIFVPAIILIVLWKVPQLQVSHLSGSLDGPAEAAELENKFRLTIAQILGGMALLAGLYYTHRRITAIEEGQITERFTRAIEQLGNKGLEFRLGGIYALERIANESEKDHWPIMEILTAYIRKNSPNININKDEKRDGEKLSIDIQAVLDVLRRRNREHEKKEFRVLDLSDTYLEGANLEWANLEWANLEWANLKEANLKVANLKGANLTGANLKEANLKMANLEWANLERANLERAYFNLANLTGAYLEGTNLTGAHLVAFLEGTTLTGANLTGAYLGGRLIYHSNNFWK
ncbi:pentapeptide repeat-containing protein [Methanosarcina sp. Mfa9]|uniref:pentapeptide repeat-containing protein n=1 Tax=Methanosarcina sp. Mfa9 TaxID=3439063 RepID=UPI003F8717EF